MRTNGSTPKNWLLIISTTVFIVSIATGLLAGLFLKNNKPAQAASANITVTSNDQTINQDESTGTTVTRTSQVTIKDTSANYGYVLSAKLSQNSIPSPTVAIGSAFSTTCPLASPCILTTTVKNILTTNNGNATGAAGDTTNWTVTITIPANTTVGNYLLDIEYNETPVQIDPMQGFSVAQCNALAAGSTLNLRDTRDNKVYKVKKMIDGRCWMIDNLAFQLDNASAPIYSPAAALISGSTASVQTQAQYAANTTAYNTAAGQTTYLYNWCAALGDTSFNCSASASATAYSTVINGTLDTTGTATSQPDAPGICPAPFRLPKGGTDFVNANNTANEFVKLDIAMGGTGINRPDANTYPLFTGTAAASNNWSGALGGNYSFGLNVQGSSGYWWSSTAVNASLAYHLNLYSSATYVLPSNAGSKVIGYAVRCVL